MVNPSQKIAYVGLFLTTYLVACGSQGVGTLVKKGTKSAPADSASQTVVENQPTSVAIESGDLQGSTVQVPAGALAAGSTVTVQEALSVPSAFSATNTTSASAPLQVGAVDADGNAITTLNEPMTIAIAFGSSGLLGLGLTQVEQLSTNLCALLEGGDGNFYIWRNGALSIDEVSQKATFSSKRLGVFQLVYCGNEDLSADFQEVDDKGRISGVDSDFVEPKDTTSDSTGSQTGSLAAGSLSLTIDPSQPGVNLNRGQTNYCILVAQENLNTDDVNDLSLLSTASVLDAGASTSIELAVDSIGAEGAVVFVYFQDYSHTCGIDLRKTYGQVRTTIGSKLMFAFTFSQSQWKEGVSGTLGNPGMFQLDNSNFEIGTPAGAAVTLPARPEVSEACMTIKSETGMSRETISLGSGGINNTANYAFVSNPQADGSSVKYELTVGTSCTALASDFVEPALEGTNIANPYQIMDFADVGSTSINRIVPSTLDASAFSGSRLCISVQDSAGSDLVFGKFLLNGAPTVYLPYEPLVDLYAKKVSTSCNDAPDLLTNVLTPLEVSKNNIPIDQIVVAAGDVGGT